MPLRHIAEDPSKQCRARSKRSKQRCLNPAAHGTAVCRNHGARKRETIKRGHEHPAYRHGDQTLEAKAERSRRLAELRELERLLAATGSLAGPRWRGRKPVASR
jgi:hypothetical protein